MQQKEKNGFVKTFSIWFDLGALMFGTFCGANMASGVYASKMCIRDRKGPDRYWRRQAGGYWFHFRGICHRPFGRGPGGKQCIQRI